MESPCALEMLLVKVSLGSTLCLSKLSDKHNYPNFILQMIEI